MTYSFATNLKAVALSASALVALAPTAQADQVILDDLIVDGSICAGLDCVNGESFGFDTIRMKENNLRLHFDDTSNSASFPRNDWRFVANDSTNGGGSYMAIEDATAGRQLFRVVAGAPSNALYVSGSGNIGLTTANPVVELHIVDGDTPTVRLEQDGSSGFTPQTWDLAGNETNFFLRDVTNGSKLPLRVRPNAPTSSIDIASDGSVGLGTTSPAARLDVSSSEQEIAVFQGTGIKLLDLKSSDNNAAQYRMITDSGNRRFVGMTSSGAVETQMVFGNNQIQLAGPTSNGANLWLTVDATGIKTKGPTCNPGPCDKVFDPAVYNVESIEEHAAFMWENQYLWGVGPTSSDQPFNLTEKTAGILHELEKAHIYIEQLHERVASLETQLAGR